MTAEKLHDAISLLPTDLIAEADRKRGGKPRHLPWHKFAALAACFALVLLAGRFSIAFLQPKGGAAPEMAADIPAAAPAESPMEAAPMAPAREEAPANGAPALDTASLALPILELQSGDTAISLECLHCSWAVPQEDGSSRMLVTDTPAAEDAYDTCVLLETPGDTLFLRWEAAPDRVSFRCWQKDGSRLEPVPQEESEDQLLPDSQGIFSLSPGRGTRLYEVTAHWTQGSASYVFRVTTPRS